MSNKQTITYDTMKAAAAEFYGERFNRLDRLGQAQLTGAFANLNDAISFGSAGHATLAEKLFEQALFAERMALPS